MATITTPLHYSSLSTKFIAIVFFIMFSGLVKLSLCFNTKQLNLSKIATHWSPAGATWYGSPDGAGSDGGACGYGGTVSQAPFSSMVTGIGPSLYKAGKGCGTCFQVKCTKHPSCSKKPVTVVITDFCPGGPCQEGSAHFDLSGTAFGGMAIPGQEKKLRDAGVLQIRYSRVACDYAGKTLAFHVDPGSNSNYFAVVVEYQEGDGDLSRVDLQEASVDSNDEWRELQRSWGADWKIDAGSQLHPPFSIRLTSQYSKQTIVAKNVIPVGWKPGATYRSLVNYL